MTSRLYRVEDGHVLLTREIDGRTFKVLCAGDEGHCIAPATRLVECGFCETGDPAHPRCAEHGL